MLRFFAVSLNMTWLLISATFTVWLMLFWQYNIFGINVLFLPESYLPTSGNCPPKFDSYCLEKIIESDFNHYPLLKCICPSGYVKWFLNWNWKIECSRIIFQHNNMKQIAIHHEGFLFHFSSLTFLEQAMIQFFS